MALRKDASNNGAVGDDLEVRKASSAGQVQLGLLKAAEETTTMDPQQEKQQQQDQQPENNSRLGLPISQALRHCLPMETEEEEEDGMNSMALFQCGPLLGNPCDVCGDVLAGGSEHLHRHDETAAFTMKVKQLLHDIEVHPHENKPRSMALQALYRMTNQERKYNRMPIVCTTKFNVVKALLPCLSPDGAKMDRRKALLILSNLAIPEENKAVLLLQPRAPPLLENERSNYNNNNNDSLLSALLRIIEMRLGETYLAAACLFNLSFLEDAKTSIVTWTCRPVKGQIQQLEQPTGTDTEAQEGSSSPSNHAPISYTAPPHSCLAILESLLIDYTPYLAITHQSVQSEAVRWSMGTLRNLVTVPANALLVCKTQIPVLAATCLEQSQRELGHWSRDSLEDASLMLLVHLASNASCLPSLKNKVNVLRPSLIRVQGQGQGIHEFRATVLLQHLEQTEQTTNDEKKEIE